MSSWTNSFHLSLACDFFYDCFCDQCEQDGRNVEAKGYCCTCKTYLCPNCYAAHLRPQARRHHVLDESEMPQKQQQQQDKNICVETCPVHPEMKMSYVCYSHREFVCKDCVARKHQNCRGVDYIPDVADEIVESGEFDEFQEAITKLKMTAQKSIQTIQASVEHTRSCNTAAHEAMHQFRDDVMDVLDRIEESVLTMAEQMTAEENERMKVLEGQVQDILQTTETIETRFSTLKTSGQLCQLFMALKRAPFEIAGLESRLADRCKETVFQGYTFELSREAQAFLQSPEKMVILENTSYEKEPLKLKRGEIHRRDVTKPVLLQRKESTTQDGTQRRDSCNQGEIHAPDSGNQREAHKSGSVNQGETCKRTGGNQEEIPAREQREAHKCDSGNQGVMHARDVGIQEEAHRKNSSYLGKVERRESSNRMEVQRRTSTKPGVTKQWEVHSGYVTKVGCRGKTDSNDRPGRSSVVRQVPESPGSQEHLLEQPSSAAATQSGADYRATAAEHIMDINVRTESDKDTPDITGSVLMSGGKLVIVDLNNSKVKLIDLAYIAVTAELEVSLPVWDIAQVSNSKAAVLSFQNNEIYVVNVTSNLTLESTINMRGPCGGISFVDDMLIVTCSEPMSVEIVSMAGEVLQTLVTTENATALFIEPAHLAVDSKHQTLYVSDCRKDSVTVLELNGKVTAVYKDVNLKGPYKLAISESGFVYICGFDSHNIHRVTANLEKQVVLQKSDGVTRPQAISCCDVTGNLYVGMWRSEILKVYQLK